MQIERSSAIKLASFAGITVLAGASHYLGQGNHVAGFLGTAFGLAGAGAHAWFGHLGVHLIEDVAEHGFNPENAHNVQNRDVHRLIGETIARILTRESKRVPGGKFGAEYLRQGAGAFRKAWMAVEPTGELKEANVHAYFSGDAELIKKAPVLEHAEWVKLIQQVAGPPPFNWREYGQALDWAAVKLREHFAFELWEAFKDAWKKDDLAWPALILRLLSLVIGRVNDATKQSEVGLGQLMEIHREVVALRDVVYDAAVHMSAKTLASRVERDKEMLEAIQSYRDDLSEKLTRIEKYIFGLHERHDRHDKDFQWIKHKLTLERAPVVFECTSTINYSLIHSGLENVVTLVETPPGITGRIFVPGFTPEARHVPPGLSANLSPRLDAKRFSDLVQPIPSSVVLELSDGRSIVRDTTVLPLCAWNQSLEFSAATAAFVLDNDPLIHYVVRRATIGPTPNAAKRSIEELLRLLFNEERDGLLFCYLYERGFLSSGEQLVRFPRQMYADRGGTRIDLAFLTAAVCQVVRLNPVVLILGESKGYRRHPLIGVWKSRDEPCLLPTVDAKDLLDGIRNQELLVWEPTTVTQNGASFEDARQEASRKLNELPVLWGIDIAAARGGPRPISPFPGDACGVILSDLPGPIVDPLTKTRSMHAAEAMKKLHVHIVNNGSVGDVVEPEGHRAYNVRIGKAPTNHVVLAHSSVSREHAVVFVRDEAVYITDLGSRNGTRIDGKLLEPYSSHPLSSDTTVQFGDVTTGIRYG